MDVPGTPDERFSHGRLEPDARPDTVGVGWPTELPGAGRAGRSSKAWTVLLVVGAVLWVPVSLLMTVAGVVAVLGWSNEDGSSTAGLVDELSVETVSGVAFVVIVFAVGVAALALIARGATRSSYRRAALVGTALALWAPVAAIALLALAAFGS